MIETTSIPTSAEASIYGQAARGFVVAMGVAILLAAMVFAFVIAMIFDQAIIGATTLALLLICGGYLLLLRLRS